MRKWIQLFAFTIVLEHLNTVLCLTIPFRRGPDTCADPSLAEVYFAGFSPSNTAHILQRMYSFVHTNTHGGDWQIQRDIFQAWGSPQEFTVPLYALLNPQTTDFIYIVSTNGNPPIADGFQALGPVANVYSTQVCGSVPLFVLAEPDAGDHWYTTLASERDDFVSLGWIDSGIAAYVLPPSSW
ncbi:hypothetical protein CVT26_000492 [Gymnopilus dilepis]|uniref:DUF5648 domain-containing protein n=1 Tax=Gymnopilus dilepis TaxID=231916 RepID=A0A409VH31_9AGAR|nr:hypothetical protein CVT26_000492 [Gymnopilus dilepis]